MNCTFDFSEKNPVLFYNETDGSLDHPEEWIHALETSRFTVQRILIPMVVLIGLVGNSISIIVLTRRSMINNTTNVYLTALAISDITYLLFIFTLSFENVPGMKNHFFIPYWKYYRYARWLTDAFSNTSTWLTVTFTAERYIAVCHPIKGKVWCSTALAKKIIIIVFLFCLISTITTPHEFELRYDPESNCTEVRLEASWLGGHHVYQKSFYWFTAALFIIIPLILLSIFNTLLILAVKRSRVRRRHLTGKFQPRDAQENKITIMLITVVILAIVCQMPTAIMLIYTTFTEINDKTLEYYVCRILGNVFNLLTAINAAVNFIFYCVMSDRYRKIFLQTFCHKGRTRAGPWSGTTVYTNIEDGSPVVSLRNSVRNNRISHKKISNNVTSTEPLTQISEAEI